MKRRYLPLLIIWMLSFSVNACLLSQGVPKNSSKTWSTRTPFLPKATYTQTLDEEPDQGSQTAGNPGKESTKTHADTPPKTPSPQSTISAETPASPEPSPISPTATEIPPSPSPSQPPKTATPFSPTKTKTPLPHTKSPTKTPLPTATSKPSPTPDQDPPPTATSSPPPTATSSPVPPAPTATPQPSGCDYSGNAGYESQVISLINDKRADHGLPALSANSALRTAARRHSQDMACNDHFSHTGTDGSSAGDRIRAAGYNYTYYAENIAASSSQYFSPETVVNLWMNSSGHRKNILSDKAVHIGVGFRYVGDDTNGDMDAYYTADFARP